LGFVWYRVRVLDFSKLLPHREPKIDVDGCIFSAFSSRFNDMVSIDGESDFINLEICQLNRSLLDVLVGVRIR
jgi:hypothetical protein